HHRGVVAVLGRREGDDATDALEVVAVVGNALGGLGGGGQRLPGRVPVPQPGPCRASMAASQAVLGPRWGPASIAFSARATRPSASRGRPFHSHWSARTPYAQAASGG